MERNFKVMIRKVLTAKRHSLEPFQESFPTCGLENIHRTRPQALDFFSGQRARVFPLKIENPLHRNYQVEIYENSFPHKRETLISSQLSVWWADIKSVTYDGKFATLGFRSNTWRHKRAQREWKKPLLAHYSTAQSKQMANPRKTEKLFSFV